MDSNKGLQTSSRAHRSYEKNFIVQIIRELEQGQSRDYLCNHYGIPPTTLKSWLSRHDLQFPRQGKRRTFTAFEKYKVVHIVLQGKMTSGQAAVAYGIKNTGLIRNWVKQFKRQNGELSSIKQQDMSKKKPVVQSADEIKTLEKELEEARLKVVALNMLIDVAEEQFKINIRKKPGAKQSPK